MATLSVDIFVCGGTVPGIIAARAAADMGMTVFVQEWTKELGGMSVSGISQIDHVKNNSCGLEHQFWLDVKAKGEAAGFVFDGTSDSDGNPYNDLFPLNSLPRNVSPAWVLAVIEDWVAHPRITVVRDTDIASIVQSPSTLRVTAALLSNGNTITFKQWVDFSYESILQVLAGIPHEYGRTSTEAWGEVNAGVAVGQIESLFKDTFPVRKANGNLFRHRTHAPTLADGQGDLTTMGFNWRLSYSTKANRLSWATLAGPLAALGYREAYFADFLDELNQRNANSINFLGTSHEVDGPANNAIHTTNPTNLNEIRLANQYPRLRTKAQREAFFDKMFLETAGRYYAAYTSAATSSALKTSMDVYGLPGDIYQTRYWRAPGWPPQPYIRSCLRARGRKTVTWANRSETIEDPICRSGYDVDSHQHYWFYNATAGQSWREGRPQPHSLNNYLVPWRIMLPHVAHCPNGLLGWNASESYIMSCDLRIEPTKMIMGQVAGIALALACQLGVDVAALPYSTLRPHITAAGIITTL